MSEIKIKVATMKVFCLVILIAENKAIAKSENRAINLKKYKSLEILESSATIREENAKYGNKRRKDSQASENKNNSKKIISVDCNFLKAKYVYKSEMNEVREKISTTVETASGEY